MEATFLAKRAMFNIPKFLPQGPPGIQSTRRVTRACLSTAYERAEVRINLLNSLFTRLLR